ncbi:hypothetical protein [Flavobacterium columnare]|uniref:hypothetical protein n=1 Tax=Flavobacterium columnare TaxID=996 RepID=UPI004033DA80
MMDNNKKVIFTDSAKVRLEKLHTDIDLQIENYLRDRKNVPGDDFIEVTASDIDDLSYRIRIIRPNKSSSRQLILLLYGAMGLLSTLIGLFYSEIKTILFEDKERLIFFVVGLTFSSVSFFLYYLTQTRERKEKEILDYEKEKRKLDDFYTKYKEH